MTKYIDLSLPVDGKFRFKVELEKIRTYEKDGYQLSHISLGTHTCTHVDAPRHFAGADTDTIDAFPVDFFIGDAAVIDVPKGLGEPITGEDLEAAGKHAQDGDIVLIRTGWVEKMWGKSDFEDSPYLTQSASDWLVDLKARMAGYDFNQDYAVREFHRGKNVTRDDFFVHTTLLGNGILNIEYLNNLSKISKPRVKVIALPILLVGSEGAWARVVAIED